MANTFEAVVAQYGVPNEDGYVLTEQAALQIFEQLRKQKTMPLDEVGYYVSEVRIIGDRNRGAVIATFKFE